MAFASAAALAVESTNIVGYTVEEGITRLSFTALASQFANVSDFTSRTVAISNLVSLTNGKAGTSANNASDQLHVWDGLSWKVYYNQTGVGFVASDADDKTVPTSDTINVGDGVFFKRANLNTTTDIRMSGAVYSGDSVSYQLSRLTYTFVGYPWPVDFAISNFVNCVASPKAGTSANNASDLVQVWDGSSWKTYFNKTGVGFVDDPSATEATHDVIPPGTCVFFRRANVAASTTLTFTKPAGL